MAVVFIELPLPLVHTVNIEVRIIADIERPDNAIIGSWLSVRGHALPDQKNLLRDECAFSIDPSTSKWWERGHKSGKANKTIPEITLHDGEVF